MATFKVTEDFDVDIAELNAAEFNINTSITAVNNITAMKTASRFYQQHQAIKTLLDIYAKLLAKEVTDLGNMATEARDLDDALVMRLTP